MTPEDRSGPVAWVVGAGGLLGGAVVREATLAGRRTHGSVVPWSDPDAAVAVLAADAERLLASCEEVDLLWCAGAGVIGTGPDRLAEEVRVVESFVAALGETARRHPSCALRVFLASSAGGLYAGSERPPFSEGTAVRPISPYGEAKLATEDAVRRLAGAGVSVLVGRIANLYGPGQDLTKPQGLITQLCRSQLQRSPLLIYVSLDTARDYLYVRDAARMVLGGMRRLAAEPAGSVVVKILASHAPTTLASILGELRRVTKRRPLTVLGASPNARFQARDLRFRSAVWTELDALASTPLPAGIAATLEDVAHGLRAVSPP